MAKYRKKPVVIEAVLASALESDSTVEIPRWLLNAVLDGTIYSKDGKHYVKTLESTVVTGALEIPIGGWIIQGIKGEIYPCAYDIFMATYEAVPEIR